MISEMLFEKPKRENLDILLSLRHYLIDIIEEMPNASVCGSEIIPEDQEDFAAVFLDVKIDNRDVQFLISLPKPCH